MAQRLATLLIEHALTLLPHRTRTVVTPTGDSYEGAELDADPLCSFTILRSGACLEKGLRRVLAETPSGSALIQSAPDTGEPLLYYLSMPACLKRGPDEARKATVLLLDSQIGTGAAALMAIRILLDHGVLEERIVFCCFLVSARGGVNALGKAFPCARSAALSLTLQQSSHPHLGRRSRSRAADGQAERATPTWRDGRGRRRCAQADLGDPARHRQLRRALLRDWA